MRTERTEPILPVRNLDETRAFYERLGFVPWWRGRGPWEYEIVSRGHLVVHFFAEPGLTPSGNDTSCCWRVKDADSWAAQKSLGRCDHYRSSGGTSYYRKCLLWQRPRKRIPPS